METLHQRSNTKVSRFILWLNMLHSVCLNLCTFFTTFSPAPLSLPLLSSYIKFILVSFFTIWPLCSGRVQSHSSTTPVVKWITLAFEVNPLKKLLREIFLASSLPFLLCHSPCPIWSHLEPERRGEAVWRWGNDNNVAPHLMCLKCLWAVRLALWSATNLMVSQVQGDVEQMDRRKNSGTWRDEGTRFGVSRGQNNRRKSLFGLLLCFRNPFNYSKLCLVFPQSVTVVMQGPVDARHFQMGASTTTFCNKTVFHKHAFAIFLMKYLWFGWFKV